MNDLCRLSASEAVERINQGKLTSEALVRACLERIEEREPEVEAWMHLDAEYSLAQARERDHASNRGPVHGLPFAVKDIMDTADMPTGYGSPIYEGYRPRADAACVAMTRAAGGVLLGKTVTTEFASRHPGKTKNPHDPNAHPGRFLQRFGRGSGRFHGVHGIRHPDPRVGDPPGVVLRLRGLQAELR